MADLAEALAALDRDALAADVAELVRVPSLTGEERPAAEAVVAMAQRLGVAEAHLVEHDLDALRAHPGHPGEEAARTELVGAEAVVRRSGDGSARIALNGHIDVVSPGDQPWSRPPFSGAVDDHYVHGRGSADMKGGVVAALHAAAAIARAGGCGAEIVVQAVPSEEDGGLGTFAALERDSAFDFALIPEPTAFGIASSQAGALTFSGRVPGVSAHASVRLEGVSAIDRYVAIHAALADHERRVNEDVGDELMRALPLPYPLSVGRVNAGTWSSQVPDLLTFEGRVGVRVDETVEQARANLEAVVARACPEASIAWTGGQFAPGATDPCSPFAQLVRTAVADELGAPPPFLGVPYGSDMRLFCERGIPCVMFGSPGLELAHAVDERVSVDDLMSVARAIVRVLARL